MSTSQDDPRRPVGNDAAGDGVEKTATEASQGTKTGYMRWVLVISLLLVVIVLGAAWLVYSGSHPHEQPPSTAQATLVRVPSAG
jgi:hypothetical protein